MDVITMISPTGLKSPVFLLKTGILILFLEEGGVLSCLLTVAGLFSRMHPLYVRVVEMGDDFVDR